MPPALRIPVALDMNSLRDQAQQASNHVAATLKVIGQGFTKLNADIVGGGAAASTAYAQGWVSSGLKIAAAVGAAKLAFDAMSGVVGAVRDQLQEMVDLAERAAKANVSPEFLQAFVGAEKASKDSAGEMEGALVHAFDASKEHAERVLPVLQRLKDLYLAGVFAADQKHTGLDLFRDAGNVEQQSRAVLMSMSELMAIGERLQALDLGEAWFGIAFTDKIRTGQRNVDKLIEDLNRRLNTGVTSGDIISSEQVQRAKDLNDRLIDAWKTVSNNLKPTLDSVAEGSLNIKTVWAEIVELLAKAAAGAQSFPAWEEANSRARVGQLQDQLKVGTGTFGMNLSQAAIDSIKEEIFGLQRWLNELDARRLKGAALRGDLDPMFPSLSDLGKSGAISNVPMPPQMPDDIRQLRANASSTTSNVGRDTFQRAADTVEKNAAANEAEAAAIDKSTDARERARISAQLETVAVQANIAAGKEDTSVTDEQRARIDAVADAYGRAALAIEKAHSPLATFARDSANVDKALNQFAASSLDTMTNDLAAVVTGTKSAKDAFKDMANSIIQDLARIAIRKSITGPLANSLGSIFGLSFGGSSSGNADTAAAGIKATGDSTIGGFAEGGPVEGPGTGTSDSILARVSRGEFIVREGPAKLNAGLLEAINRGGRVLSPQRGYATGGFVAAPGGEGNCEIICSNCEVTPS